MKELEKKNYSRFNWFQNNIAHGKPNDWRCRAGARYLYICEDGLVHYCSQQRGYPGIPLEQYSVEDIRREFLTEKSCAPHCTVSCVHQVSYYRFLARPADASSRRQRRSIKAAGADRLASCLQVARYLRRWRRSDELPSRDFSML